ncbi:MAG: HNH endonuclease [Bacteroidota bacterium]
MAKRSLTEKWVLMTELNGEPLLHHFKLSNFGNVIKIKKGVGDELEFKPSTILGYEYISFTTRQGSRETIYLHRLIAEFFVKSQRDNAQYVIHKDYSRKNNRYDNLKWVTKEELKKHRSAKAGRLPAKLGNKKKITDPTAPVSETVDAKKYQLRKTISQLYNVVN